MKNKRVWMLLVLAAAICTAVIIPIMAGASTDYSEVRIRIQNGSPVTEKITVIGSFTLKEDSGFGVAGSVTIKNQGGSLVITSGSKTKTVGSRATLVSANAHSPANLIKMKGYGGTNSYAGDMIFSASGGGVRAINRVPMEQYILGVIYPEMNSSFHLEALKAQAVAARSYAAVKINSSRNNEYHMDDGPTHQAYRGYISTAVLNQAVEQTKGQMMLYNNKPIEALYSAAHGGQSDLPGNKYGGGDAKDKAYPYLAMFDDPYDLKGGKAKGFYEQAFLPGQLKGNKSKVNKVLWGDIMAAFGLSRDAGESQLSNATINSVTPVQKFPRTPNSRFYTGARLNVTLNGSTKNVTIDLTQLYKRGVFKKSHLSMTSLEAGSEGGVAGWYLTNQRYGHGLGLSQYGANQMAKEGFNYVDILHYYYKNCSIATYDTGNWSVISGGVPEGEAGWQSKADGVYYYDTNGRAATGWKQLDNGSGATGWYYFSSNGKRSEGWIKPGKVWYYLEPGTGIMLSNTVREIDGELYAFSGNGDMLKNKWKQHNGSWYYLNSSGAAAGGWIKDKAIWYYLNPADKKMLTGTHGIDGLTYILDASGAMMRNGWKLYGGTWYYLNGAGDAHTGWKKDKGLWYYMNPADGKMLTGVKEIEGEIYFLNIDGAMFANGWRENRDSNQGKTGWYLLDNTGAAIKGWKHKGAWYYMDPQDAVMATGEREVDGLVYTFGADGAMLGSRPVSTPQPDSAQQSVAIEADDAAATTPPPTVQPQDDVPETETPDQPEEQPSASPEEQLPEVVIIKPDDVE